jgi:hypothetical protein
VNDREWLEKRVSEIQASFTPVAKTKPEPKPKPVRARPTPTEGCDIFVYLPGQELEIHASDVTISFDRDYLDATVFGDVNKTYLVGRKKFKIEGEYG